MANSGKLGPSRHRGGIGLPHSPQGRCRQTSAWSELGLQTANGISTLALTFTLFGISMGIGSLSEQPLSQENVESVISELTAQFSIAFMTTVVGLPTAALIRAVISVRVAKHEINEVS